MADTVAVFKISTGEEVIGRVGEQSDTQLVLSKPRTMIMVPGQQQGEIGLQLLPFLAANPDGDIAISLSQIVATTSAGEALERMYLQNTSPLDLSPAMPG